MVELLQEEARSYRSEDTAEGLGERLLTEIVKKKWKRTALGMGVSKKRKTVDTNMKSSAGGITKKWVMVCF